MSEAANSSSSSNTHVSWPLEQGAYRVHRKIGKGAFSVVNYGVCLDNKMKVAIKCIDLETISTSFDDILMEVQTMRLCAHENVLKCYCSFVASSQLWLVTEYLDKGSCHRVMAAAKQQIPGYGDGMNEEWLAYVLQQTLQGLEYLHEKGHIHRDIKCNNILLDSRGNVRLADFGVAGWTISKGLRNDTVKTFVGTPAWMAPEVLEQNEGYDNKADIWSLGITALEMAKGVAPYAQYAPMRILVLTIEEDPPSLKSYADDKQRTGAPFSKYFEDFYKKCLQKSPKNRATISELMKHKFLSKRTAEALKRDLLDHIDAVGTHMTQDEGTEEVLHAIESLQGDDDETVTRAPLSGLSIPGGDGIMNKGEINQWANTNEGELNQRALSRLENATKNKEYTAGTTWTFDDSSVDDNAAAFSPGRDTKEMNEFMETFETEISLNDTKEGSGVGENEDIEKEMSTPVKRDSEGELNITSSEKGDVINGMVRVRSLTSSTGRFSPSIAAQDDNHDYDVDDFLDEMEELVDER